MTTPPQDDLTAERAAFQLIWHISQELGILKSFTVEDFEREDVYPLCRGHIIKALKTARQEALREAITKIRQRGDEYMRDCEAKDASGKKYRDTYEMRRVNSGRAWAFKDLADELDRLASEGG